MPEVLKKVCWDTCSFLSFIEATPGRISDLQAVFQEAIRHEIRLHASAICITEVAFVAAERSGGLDPRIEDKINDLWRPGSPIRVVDYSQLIAGRAQKLLRESLRLKLKLKPLDAIHIATAMQVKAHELHTYDKKLEQWSTFAGVRITEAKPFQMLLSDDE